MATYGSFPGVRVQTESGGISGVQIGEEEKLVLFGEADYDSGTNEVSGAASAEEVVQLNARREANDYFGDGSELAEAMKEALANGANMDYLYGVAVDRSTSTDEPIDATGTLDNVPVEENQEAVSFDTVAEVEFRYNGAPATDGGYDTAPEDMVFLNPLTGEYAVSDGATSVPTQITYNHLGWESAFGATDVNNIVNEDETGVYVALSDSDLVSQDLQGQVSTLRNDYQLVNALTVAEPNATQVSDDTPARARYSTSDYSGTANQSIVEEYFYKFAPGRQEGSAATVMGGMGGLFAGNPINDPIYNEALSGYQGLEQSFSKTDADNMRGEDIIPVRDAGTIRVKGNRSTAYSESDAVGADFWVRRITDRVILIGKLVGDNIIGRINDEETRSLAERQISAQMRSLVRDRLLRSNAGSEVYWAVEVYEDSTNDDEVNIDITFTPYGIVKRVDETITINTN